MKNLAIYSSQDRIASIVAPPIWGVIIIFFVLLYDNSHSGFDFISLYSLARTSVATPAIKLFSNALQITFSSQISPLDVFIKKEPSLIL